MTTDIDTSAALVDLPAGHADAGSFWHVPAALIDWYRKPLDRINPTAYQDSLRILLTDQALDAERETILADYCQRFGIGRNEALKYVADPSGRVRVESTFAQSVSAACSPGGANWPPNAVDMCTHLARLDAAKHRAQVADADARDRAQYTCDCGSYDRTDNALRAANRRPVAGLPAVRCCERCADAIAFVAAERAVNAVGPDGRTRRDYAATWLDSLGV
ncbi:hypothetical protein AAFP35_25530 [Gordonia sp. CPCC 206044]|uniref:hypothetical protein n=1 Tax=Gordonia sp. CPCC 206044 TaxID=3140793 RepID=UPI003AF339DF